MVEKPFGFCALGCRLSWRRNPKGFGAWELNVMVEKPFGFYALGLRLSWWRNPKGFGAWELNVMVEKPFGFWRELPGGERMEK